MQIWALSSTGQLVRQHSKPLLRGSFRTTLLAPVPSHFFPFTCSPLPPPPAPTSTCLPPNKLHCSCLWSSIHASSSPPEAPLPLLFQGCPCVLCKATPGKPECASSTQLVTTGPPWEDEMGNVKSHSWCPPHLQWYETPRRCWVHSGV